MVGESELEWQRANSSVSAMTDWVGASLNSIKVNVIAEEGRRNFKTRKEGPRG